MLSIQSILPELKKDYPQVSFKAGEAFVWSPSNKQITYTTHQINAEHGAWAILHELAHYELEHTKYSTDFELLKMEAAAWTRAKKIAKKYNVKIDNDHIQDCLDTYRDWLHTKAKCPNCQVISTQRKDLHYQCFNCNAVWTVPKSPLCKIKKQIVNL